MNKLLDLIRLIPNTGKIISVAIIILGVVGLVFYRWGLVPAVFVLVAIGVIALAVLLYNQAVKVKQRQDGLAFGKALNAAHRGPGKEEVKSAVDSLSQKWQEAMNNLKSRKIDIYHLPWYMLIGEPQSGKSTTLEFSGLEFPIGKESISGGGGTRNCDWWFTEQGVILDTAGRFTFQESTATDSAEWGHFLQLLAKHRPYCPINGVILVIPTDALLANDPATLEQKARNISDKLLHIQRTLAIQFPVYVMITKCDLIYGFTQFFNKLNADAQREMLGWSSDHEESGFDAGRFGESFERMAGRLDGLRLQHLSQPHFVDDLDKTFVFPEEFRALREPLQRYLEIIFQPSVYKDPIFFRGYYFSSGMQEGQPIVKACAAMMGDRSMLEKLENLFKRSRAFFVRDFYTRKVFPEEGLVRRASQYARKDQIKRRLIMGMNIGMLVIGGLLMWGMYSSLAKRLDAPKRAIAAANERLRTSNATFFGAPEERLLIFETLQDLRQGVDTSSSKSFLIFLKSRQNALTEHLQDTFAYLFLDRIMLDLENGVNQQLRDFGVARPATPRSSKSELDQLCRALAELKRWQLMVARDEPTDFDPTILPFLEITASPEWDNELAAYRGSKTVVNTLEDWFQEVYRRSSNKTRAFLIEEMVRRSDGMYSRLEKRVEDFYINQPELLRYDQKTRMIENLLADYELLTSEAPADEYHDRLLALSDYFTDDNLRIINNTADGYLDFDTVRNTVISALGPAFEALKPEVEGEEESLSSKAVDAAGAGREQGRLPDVVNFVNRLIAVDATDLPNPKQNRAPGEDGHLGFPPEIDQLWEKILKPYTQEFVPATPYAGMPDATLRLDGNLTALFDAGEERAGQLRRMFDTEMINHADMMTDDKKKNRFEGAMTEFHDALMDRERERVTEVMKAVVSGKVTNAPSPPSSWSRLVSDFNRLSGEGRKFDAFLKGPADLTATLAQDYKREIRAIYGRDDTPERDIETYIDNAGNALGRFGQVLTEMNNIPDRDLARNKSKYSGSFPEARRLRELKNIADTPDFLVAHKGSLARWADQAVDSFRVRVSGADPCPECKVAWRDLEAAWRLLPGGFPVHFDGNLQVEQIETGRTRVIVTMTPKDKLDAFINQLEIYRQPGTKHRQHLKEIGQETFVDEALAWADGAKRIMSGETILFKVEPPTGGSDLDDLTEEVAFGRMSGALTTRKLNLNSPRLLDVTVNAAAENDITVLRFYNDTAGNQTESILEINQGLAGLVAFSLENAAAGPNGDYFTKTVLLSLNIAQRKVEAAFHLKLSNPIPAPPDWSPLEQ